MRPSFTPIDAPTELVAGDTVTWKVRAPNTLPGDGWTLRVTLIGPVAADAAAVADETDADVFVVTFSADTTSALPGASYRWIGSAERVVDGTRERFSFVGGRIAVQVDPANIAGDAGLTHAERSLAAAERQIEQLLATPVEEYDVDGASAKRRKLEDLQRERSRYAQEVWRQRNGGRLGQRMEVSFGSRR